MIPEGYEEVQTEYGTYMRRAGDVDLEMDRCIVSEMRRLHNPIRRWFVDRLTWTEDMDPWLHKHGWHIEPICALADFCYSAPLDLRWIFKPWRWVSYHKYQKGDGGWE